MFELMPGQWTPAVPLTALGGNPVALELAGEAVVAFRDGQVAWHALLDRCPHRSARLSLGEVTAEGTLQCRYHGWRFAGDGQCKRVPLNELNERALARIRATALPTREIGGALWIFTGTQAPAEPQVPEPLRGPPGAYGTYCQEWNAHWTRAVENFIDFAHPPYLHRETIGAYSHDFAERGGTAEVVVEERDDGFSTFNFMGSRSYGFQVDWHAPNLSCLHFGARANAKLFVFSIPINATRTRVMTVRQLPRGYDPATYARRAADVDHQILDEDRVVVESHPTGPVPGPDGEVSVATDAPTVAFRRWYRDLMAAHAAAASAKA